jgi:hypothetical protein
MFPLLLRSKAEICCELKPEPTRAAIWFALTPLERKAFKVLTSRSLRELLLLLLLLLSDKRARMEFALRLAMLLFCCEARSVAS